MSTRHLNYAIYCITLLLGGLIFYGFSCKTRSHEWFALGSFLFISIGVVALFVLVLAAIGFILIYLNQADTGKTFIKSIKWSTLFLGLTLAICFFKSQNALNTGQANQAEHWADRQQVEKELQLRKLDSLAQLSAFNPCLEQ